MLLSDYQRRPKSLLQLMGVAPASVGIKGYKSRLGTCHSDGRVYFNWRIIMAPHAVVDYVIVHELSHLVHHDHSKNFWNHVERSAAGLPREQSLVAGQWPGIKGMTQQQPGTLKNYRKSYGGI